MRKETLVNQVESTSNLAMLESVVEQHIVITKGLRGWKLVLGILCAGGLVWGGWVCWTAGRYHSAITAIKAEMASNRFAIAASKAGELMARYPGSDEPLYLLGVCERKRGRSQAAADVLARVTPGSEFSQRAIFDRMRLFHESGRFAVAEQIILDAAEDPRNERTGLRVLLVPIYSQLGRLDESRRLVEDQWEHLSSTGQGASERAIDLVRMHIEIDFKPNPIANVRAYLDPALRMASEDDRVWLGQANLALRMCDYDKAWLWLNACLQRRPADLPVWRSRLRWGMATNRIDVVQQSLLHLSAGESTPAELHRLNAWFASRRGDLKTERQELVRLIEAAPADLSALDRLAQLAEQDGQPAEAAELVRKKAEIDRLRARYETLFDRQQPIRDAVEMAQLAEHLGRVFEARVFLTLAISAAPEREDLRRDLVRLSRSSTKVAHHGVSNLRPLADLHHSRDPRVRVAGGGAGAGGTPVVGSAPDAQATALGLPSLFPDLAFGRQFGQRLSLLRGRTVLVVGDLQSDDPLGGQFFGVETMAADPLLTLNQPLHFVSMRRCNSGGLS